MKKIHPPLTPVFFVWLLLLFLFLSCKGKRGPTAGTGVDSVPAKPDTSVKGIFTPPTTYRFDSGRLGRFFEDYPELKNFEADMTAFYRARNFSYAWFDRAGILEQASVLWTFLTDTAVRATAYRVPYADKISAVVHTEEGSDKAANEKAKTDAELLLTGAYLDYATAVWSGLPKSETDRLEWYLPRKQMNYKNLLAEAASGKPIDSMAKGVLSGYYLKLKSALAFYESLQKTDTAKAIAVTGKSLRLKPGERNGVVPLVKERLRFLGYKVADATDEYNEGLGEAVSLFKKTHGLEPDAVINRGTIAELNVPVAQRIRQIVVNLERFRWIPADFAYDEFIVVNIPEYALHYYENKKPVWDCRVVVGKPLTKTVVFSGLLQSVVFSPYWYVPQSIINGEVKPGMNRNKNYLAAHNMEWNGGNVRQKPGPSNSLGRVKFLFPNTNNIYLHDTPAKSLFGEEDRAFSHGCVRVGAPKDLAIRILRGDPAWTPEKIERAMSAGAEQTVTLKKKIPVYIGYFTAFVDRNDNLNFRKDVYGRDERLYQLLTK